MHTNGVINMDAWEYIGTSIRGIKDRHYGRAEIFAGIDHRTEIRPVRKYGTDYQTDGHSCKQHGAKSVIVFYIGKEKV